MVAQQQPQRDVFRALADPTRRAILSLIAVQAMTPGGLASHFDISRQAVSKHIRILTESRLLEQEQSGREIYYHINFLQMQEVEHWMAPFRRLWEARFTSLDEVLLKNKKRNK